MRTISSIRINGKAALTTCPRVTSNGATATGALTILETTETVAVPMTLTESGTGAAIEGEVRLDMTDYGVEPPTVMLGMLRVRPQITIEFGGTVAP